MEYNIQLHPLLNPDDTGHLHYSYSSLFGLYENCPRKFFYQKIMGFPIDIKTKAQNRGRRAHKKIEHSLRGSSIGFNPGFEKREFIEETFYLNNKLEYTEEIKDAVFVAVVDYAIFTFDGTLYIIDWKTGSTAGNLLQLLVYALCLTQKLKPKQTVAQFFYLDRKNQAGRPTIITDEHLTFVKNRIQSVSDKILQSTFEPNVRSWYCANQCSFLSECI